MHAFNLNAVAASAKDAEMINANNWPAKDNLDGQRRPHQAA